MSRALAVVTVVLAGCMTPPMHFGGGTSAKQGQHERLADRTPGRLSFEKSWTGPVADEKIRVYADDDYRAQNQRWREAFDERLDYVNAVMGARFGVHLVADYREWSHHAPGESLDEQLAELVKLDAGGDVFAVVGCVSALGLAPASFDQLGLAELGGKHLVIRGYADVDERRAYDVAFRDLASDERSSAYETMKRHRNASVFLHELGHNLGAGHEDGTDTLMSPAYSRKATGFSLEAEATILRTLERRLGRTPAAEIRHVAARDGTSHGQMVVVVVAGGAVVDGVSHEDDDLDLLFSSQAKIDLAVEVVVKKGDGATAAAVTKLVDRLARIGFKNIRFE